MRPLLLFPFGGNAREAVAVVQAVNAVRPTFDLRGFVDDEATLLGRDYHGIPVLGGRDVLARHPDALVLAVPGRPENFRRRDRIIALLGLPESRFATVIHPSVQVGPGCSVGHDCLLMAGVVLTADVTIGNHCVILPNSVVSHDARLGDYCMLGSGVSVSGSVRLGPKCYIGSGSKLIQEIELGEGTLVGLGSVVLRGTAPGSTVVGNPARVLGPTAPSGA